MATCAWYQEYLVPKILGTQYSWLWKRINSKRTRSASFSYSCIKTIFFLCSSEKQINLIFCFFVTLPCYSDKIKKITSTLLLGVLIKHVDNQKNFDKQLLACWRCIVIFFIFRMFFWVILMTLSSVSCKAHSLIPSSRSQMTYPNWHNWTHDETRTSYMFCKNRIYLW